MADNSANKTSNTIRCVYCLGEFPKEEITVDHVIARSWYPKDGQAVQKWKAPSCLDCNNKKSSIEGNLLRRIALCLNPAIEGEKAIIDKIFRSIDPKKAKGAKDAMHRYNAKAALLKETIKLRDRDATGVLPSFQVNFDKGSRTGVLIPAEALEVLIVQWVRGIHFCEIGEYIEENKEISTYQVSDEDAHEIFKDTLQYAHVVEKGSGVRAYIWHAKEGDRSATQYAFILYDQFKSYASVDNFEAESNLEI